MRIRSDSDDKGSQMGGVRIVTERDVEAIAKLYLKVYGRKYANRQESLGQNLRRMLLENPWRDSRFPSLVFENKTGDIVGCVGVVPRPMIFEGRTVTAAVTHSLMVEPGSRSSLAALSMAKEFFGGHQDLSLADVNSASRKLWERAGGYPTLVYSMCWLRLIRPCKYALSFLKNRGLPVIAAAALSPAASVMDFFIRTASATTFKSSKPESECASFESDVMANELSGILKDRALRPSYTEASAAWLVREMAENSRFGTFKAATVRDGRSRTVGWYMYLIKPSGVGEVAQLVSSRGHEDAVLESLFTHAEQNGAVALTGQVDPPLIDSLSEKQCLFFPIRRGWVMLHSRNHGIMDAFNAGKAYLSRLESEWWISSIVG